MTARRCDGVAPKVKGRDIGHTHCKLIQHVPFEPEPVTTGCCGTIKRDELDILLNLARIPGLNV